MTLARTVTSPSATGLALAGTSGPVRCRAANGIPQCRKAFPARLESSRPIFILSGAL